MPLLVDAVAFIVQAAVEIEINPAGGQGLAEKDSAYAVRQVGKGGKDVSPKVVFGRGVVNEVEKLFGLFV
ncbi:MAG TPA: hypothetical protein VHB49_02565 [Bradyrhizobium sp.]|nr:hypothetical protein [Bradyrhizobium sp.]